MTARTGWLLSTCLAVSTIACVSAQDTKDAEDFEPMPPMEQQNEIVKDIACDVCNTAVETFWHELDEVKNPDEEAKKKILDKFCNNPDEPMSNPYRHYGVEKDDHGKWVFRRKAAELFLPHHQKVWREDVVLRACSQVFGGMAFSIHERLKQEFDKPEGENTLKVMLRCNHSAFL